MKVCDRELTREELVELLVRAAIDICALQNEVATLRFHSELSLAAAMQMQAKGEKQLETFEGVTNPARVARVSRFLARLPSNRKSYAAA